MNAHTFRLTGRLRTIAVAPILALLLVGLAFVLAPSSAYAQTPSCNGQPATIYVDGSNIIQGGPGNGLTYAGVLTGTVSADVIVGTAGNDTISGNNGSDIICGGSGNDTINGGQGQDTIYGESGNDTLNGDGQNDTLIGGAGTDTINGGAQTDACSGETETGCESDPTVGTVVIAKDAVPNHAQDFTFTGAGSIFILDDDSGAAGADATYPVSETLTLLSPATYTVTEASVSGWQVSGVSCTDPTSNSSVSPADRRAVINLATNEIVTCTFTNTQPVGNIVVKKVSVGGDGSFGFSSSFTTTKPFTLTTVGGVISKTFANLTPGSSYTLTEKVPAGWVLTGSSCDQGTLPNGISVTAGMTTTCTFTNTVGLCHATPNDGATVFSSTDAHAVQQAVDAASAGGHVKVAGECVGVELRALTLQSTYISKTLTLEGGYTTADWTTSVPLANPTTIDANSDGRVLRIVGVPIEIVSLTLQGGQIAASGGGVRSDGVVTLTNVSVLSNTASGFGGGVAADGAVKAVNSRFENNRSTTNSGGGLYTNSTLWLTNTHFLSNTAIFAGGGAGANGAATAVNSRFENNRSTNSYGGGLYANSTLWLTNTHFLSNTASNFGGGATVVGAVTVATSRFVNNHSTTSQGGGLYANSTLWLTDTHFLSNTASSIGGGARAIGAVTAANSRFENNRSTTSQGGGLYAQSTLWLTDTHFLSNTAFTVGGGVYALAAITAVNSRFENNRSTNSSGGGLYANSTLWLTNTHFISNTASGFGGGANAGGAVTAVNSRFENNRTDGFGGGLYTGSTLWLTNSHFLSNTAPFDGGGAGANGAVTAVNSRFENNSTNFNGGGLWAGSTLWLTNTHFLSNTASEAGGGGAFASGAVTAANSRFENNRTSNRGGGLYAGTTLLLTNTHFLSNTALTLGGGVYAVAAITAVDSRFENNRSTNGNGGGLFANSTLWLTNTHFISNTALFEGGGIFLFGGGAATERLVNVLMAGNRAGGAGQAVVAAHDSGNDSLSILHTTIASPTLAGGAAVVVQAGTALITDTIVTSHTVGISQTGSSVVTQDYNLFFGNGADTAGTVGGGANSVFGAPAFLAPAADDYRLTASSAAIDVGVDMGVTTDFFGDVRPQGGGFDMGYDESPYTAFGNLVIRKVSVGGDGSFGFTGNVTTTNPFTIATVGGSGAVTITNVASGGGYTVTEITPPGWSLQVAACDNGAPNNITVVAGLTTTCTFTNTKNAVLHIIKNAVPDDPQSFDITAYYVITPNVTAAFTQTLQDIDSGGITWTLATQTPSTIAFGEKPVVGWELTDLRCTTIAGSAWQTGTHPINFRPWVVIDALPGDIVNCTFTNTKLGTIIIEKVTNPPGLTDATFSPRQWVTVNSPVTITGNYPAEGATFGPPLNATGVTGNLELVNDGTAPTSNGCEPLVGFTAGNIALIDRGLCFFTTKVKNAQDAGAIAVVIANNIDDETFVMSPPENPPVITIPSLLIGKSSGDTLKSELPGVNVTLRSPLGGVFTLDDGQAQTIGDLLPGQYTIFESEGRWLVDDLVCDDQASSNPSVVDLDDAFVTVNLEPGETVACTFTNIGADLAIAKSVTPASASPGQLITYTLTYANAGPGDAIAVVISDSLPVSVSLVSIASSGATITQTSGPPDLTWNVEPLSPGEGGVITITVMISANSSLVGTTIVNSVTITASNEITPTNNSDSAAVDIFGPVGTLIVQKVVVGTPPASAWQFVGPTGAFTLPAVGGSAVFTPLAVGPYTISETPQAGYTASSACSNGASGAASVNVTLGSAQTITCTFTNTRQFVDIVIVKQSVPQSSTNFRFTGSYLGGGSGSDSGSSIADFYLDDAAPDDGDAYGSSKRFTVPRGAIYSFAEPAVSGWYLASITCTPPGSATVTLATRSVTINTSSGYDVTCIFRNEKAAALTVRKYRESNGTPGQQAPEAFLSTWTIQVKMPSPTSTLVSQAATNALGKVSFSLKPGSYQVCEVMKSGWTQKVPAGNACHILTLLPGSATQVDFGNCPNSSCPVMASEAGGADAPVAPLVFTVPVDDLDGWVEQWLLTPDGPTEETLEPDAGDDGDAGLRVFLPVVVK